MHITFSETGPETTLIKDAFTCMHACIICTEVFMRTRAKHIRLSAAAALNTGTFVY